MNPNKKPSPAEMARIKAAFSTLNKGDVIRGEHVVSLVVIRMIEGKGAVLGHVCNCRKMHLVRIFDATYSWSDEKQALVADNGEIPEGWSYDLEVHRGDGMKVAEAYAHVPIMADYYNTNSQSEVVDALLDKKGMLVMTGAEMLHFGSEVVSMKKVLKLIGVEASEEQALVLAAIVASSHALEEPANPFGGDVLGDALIFGIAGALSRGLGGH